MIDPHSPTWLALKAKLEARLATLRVLLEADRPEAETARLRGAIGEIKAVLAYAEPPPRPDATGGVPY